MAEILKSVRISDDIVYLNVPEVTLEFAPSANPIDNIEERLELARQKGFEQGRQQNIAEADVSMSERAEMFDRLLATIPNAINDNRLALRTEIADIVWSITKQFFIQQQLSKDTIIFKVMETLEQLNEAQHIELFLHPNDLAFLHQENIQLDLKRFKHLRISPDDHLILGGCKIKTEHGLYDASIERQIDRLKDVLLELKGDAK